jgi:hypothetical protein
MDQSPATANSIPNPAVTHIPRDSWTQSRNRCQGRCPEKLQSARWRRVDHTASASVLDLITSIEHQRSESGQEDRLPQADLLHQLGRNRERKDKKPNELKRTAETVAPHGSKSLSCHTSTVLCWARVRSRVNHSVGDFALVNVRFGKTRSCDHGVESPQLALTANA